MEKNENVILTIITTYLTICQSVSKPTINKFGFF